MSNKTVNVVIAGLGGQGVIKASDILAEVAFLSGLDVKKSELHGMSQRGGSVSSDVRFGHQVFSPMVPAGEADFLIVVEPTQIEVNREVLAEGGTLIEPAQINTALIKNKKSVNVALLGALSLQLDFPVALWHNALRHHLAEKLHETNLLAFAIGRGESCEH